jgi:hypothetical protein
MKEHSPQLNSRNKDKMFQTTKTGHKIGDSRRSAPPAKAPFATSPYKLKKEPAYSPCLITTLRAPMNEPDYSPRLNRYNYLGGSGK